MWTRSFLLTLAGLLTPSVLLPAQEGSGRRVAVLVGVQQYTESGLSNLKYAENDVHALADVLREQGYGRILLLTRSEWRRTDRDDRLPTAENIRATLQAELGDLKPGDSVFVAFAGHGAHLKAHDKLFFCPIKANLDKPETLVALDEVYGLMKECKAGTRVLLVDACRNDPADGRTAQKLDSISRPLVPDPPGGIVALFSCSKGQVAYESDRNQRGFLFHFVNEGLRGKAAHPTTGEVTWPRLVTYVTEELPGAVRDERTVNARQTPEYFGTGRDLVLARVVPGESAFRRAHRLHLGENGERCDLLKAVALYREAAREKHPLAVACLAAFAVYGLADIAIDPVEAKRLGAQCLDGVRKLAATGRPEAQNLLGILHQFGLGVETDLKEAARWYRLAGEQNLPVALCNLGNLHATGQLGEPNLAEALRLFRKAAEMNYPSAIVELGLLYQTGRGVAKDEPEAVRLFRKAVEQNHAGGLFRLAIAYENGLGIEKDPREAFRLYRRAAEEGLPSVLVYVGDCYYSGVGVEKDQREAERWYRKGADLGQARAQISLGLLYENGEGVAKDLAEAVRWYRKAADQNDAEGFYRLGVCSFHGNGVVKNEKEACQWFRKAAEAGYAPAQVSLGVSLEEGHGVAKDPVEAVRWYRKAAEQDDAEGQTYLGHCYADGVGIAQDEREAVRLYRKAAEKGLAEAQYSLGVMYADGRGIGKDLAEAKAWFRKAADQGHAEAKKELRRLRGE